MGGGLTSKASSKPRVKKRVLKKNLTTSTSNHHMGKVLSQIALINLLVVFPRNQVPETHYSVMDNEALSVVLTCQIFITICGTYTLQ